MANNKKSETPKKEPRTIRYNDPASLNPGDFFTVFVPNDCDNVEIKMAKGRIFRFRHYIHPFVFADHRPLNQTKWVDSPWRIDILSGSFVMKVPESALFHPEKKTRKKTK